MNNLETLFANLNQASGIMPNYTPTFARKQGLLDKLLDPTVIISDYPQDNPDDWEQDIFGNWRRKSNF